MATELWWLATCEYWTWRVRPVDADGTAIDPTGMAVEFAAVALDTPPGASWAAILAQAEGSATGSWAGPDDGGYYTARVLLSGTGGGGDIEVPAGTWSMLARITATPELPVETTGVVVMR